MTIPAAKVCGAEKGENTMTRDELEKRKGQRPSPGTLYPALKALQEKGLIRADEGKEYSLTPRGREELEKSLHLFTQIFADFKEMQGCCGKVKA